MNYEISIILPVYNVEKYIKQSFESLLNQTFGFSNLEIIFVDDCSTDGSPEIIDDYSMKYPNVSAYHLDENSGFAGKPRNVGINKSTGDFLLFLDSDDLLEEYACEKLYAQIKDNPDVDMVVGGYTNFYSDGRIFSEVPGGFKGIYPDGLKVNRVPEDTPELTISRNPKMEFRLFSLSASISSKLIRKELLTKNNIYYEEGIPSQDTIFVYDVLINANHIAILNDYSVYTRIVRSQGKDKSTSFDVDYSFIIKLLKANNIISDKCDALEIEEYVQPIVFVKMITFFLNRFKNPEVRKEDVDRIICTEEYDRFRNRNFIKSHAEFDIIFDNIYNLEDNYEYSVFLKSAVINRYKNRKRIRILTNQIGMLNVRCDDLNSNIENLNKKIEELENDKKLLITKNKKLSKEIEIMKNSHSWKVTAPLRKIGKIVK